MKMLRLIQIWRTYVNRLNVQLRKAVFKPFFGDITPKDKVNLEALGYTVKEIDNFKFPIVISWE